MIAYVDESVTDKDYVVVAALIRELDVDLARSLMNILQTRGQLKIHWTKESDARRSHLIYALTKMKWWEHLLVVRVARDGERVERQRRLSLERLWYELVRRDVDTVIMESRQKAQDRSDLKHLAAMRSRHVIHRELSVRHVPGAHEPMLACADIVAGAYRAAQRGWPEYLESLTPKVTVIEVEPNWGR